ncbi:MAG: BREX system P-loop protein BrxC [Pseudomonadota bacterium]
MKIKDILQRDPASPLVNQGQARIADEQGAALDELRGELSSFVCEGQYAAGLHTIIESFLRNLGKTNQRSAWVSGFFGSGKSHLLKMLCHLWKDTAFPDGATARALVPAMPDELRALLRELDTAGRRAGGLVAAAGSLPSGTTENVRLTILGVLLKAVGLPEQYPQARFCLWLKANGFYDKVVAHLKTAGRDFERELNNLYVSGPLMRAILACDPNFASDEAQAKQHIKAQFPPQLTDITTAQFLSTAKEALKLAGTNGRLPCTLLVLDETQQYIGESYDRSVLVTEVVEALSKQLDSQLIVVCSGQSTLTEHELLKKMLDRFTIRVTLSDNDVETVTRKVLLQKKPSAIGEVRKLLDHHAGEVSRQLQGTRIGEVAEDRRVIVDDFPLLPVRRRFWEHCFRQIDAAGTSSQLRSQLRIIHDSVARLAEKPMSAVVPADDLYDALAPEMVNTGVLLREINERILQVGKTEGELARRICGLVFLIGKLKREAGADIGVRATQEHLSDLLVSDLAADNGKLRSEVAAALKKLADAGVLMLLGDEYRLQTREGAEWDREFRNRQTKLGADAATLKFLQDQLLYAEADRIIRTQRLTQGAAKESRQFLVHRDQTPPPVDGSSIPVWIRDGWSCAQREVEEAARRAGTESPIIYIFIAQQAASDLKRVLIDAEAARQTLDAKGNPTTDEGRDARQGMESRRSRAEAERERLVREIVANAKLYQGGGGEVLLATLEEKLKAAANDALIRLFPRFKEADSGAWEAVIKRARDGADHPFQPVGHADATEKHAVCQQVLTTIGAGKSGTEIRKTLRASPFGWPQDAIDAALIALHRSQHITATLNGAPVVLGQLDQNKIAKAEFRAEAVTLSVQDRLRLRKLYQAAGLNCKSGEEAAKAHEFLDTLLDLARAAGGEPPLPAAPATVALEDLQRLAGNEQLAALKNQAAALEAHIQAWQTAAELATARRPAWAVVEKLAAHAAGLPAAEAARAQVKAVRDQRLLLEPTDPVAPLRQQLAKLLREAVTDAVAAHRSAFDAALHALDRNPTWKQVPESDRAAILNSVGLTEPAPVDVSTDENLATTLQSRNLSAMRAECDAIAGRMTQAIERAARLLEPKVQPVIIERATLHNDADLDAWIDRQRQTLTASLKRGPVLVQ